MSEFIRKRPSVPSFLFLLYERVETLFSFTKRHVHMSLPIKAEFHNFLINTIIGSSAENQSTSSSSTNSEFYEVLNIAHQILHEKADWKHNQLTLGEKQETLYFIGKHKMQDMLKNEHFSFVNNEYFENLHKLLGDKLLLHLLTRCSIFELAKESCYIQRTGLPTQVLYKEKICNNAINSAGNILHKEQIICNSGSIDDQNLTRGKENKKRGLSDSITSTKKRQRTEMNARKKTRRKKVKKMKNNDAEFEIFRNKIILFLMSQSKFSFSLEISRSHIFCCKDFKCKFPDKHILSQLQVSDLDVRKLACSIFSCNDDYLLKILTNDEYKCFHDQLELLIDYHRSCPFQNLLSRYCPMKLKQKFSSISLFLEQHVSEKQMVQFLRSVLRFVIPSSFLGVKANFQHFLKRIKILITSGKSDMLRLFYFTHMMKTKHCSWLISVSDTKASAFLLGKVIHWLLDYILSILKGFFYITESGVHKKKLFFYRKPVWQKIQALCLNEFLKEGKITSVPLDKVKRLCDEGKCIGVSTLRFLAKPSSVRQILKSPKRTKLKTAAGYQSMPICNVTCIFEHIKLYHPSLFGCGKSTLDDIYHSWKEFICYRRKNNMDGPPCFIKVDLQDCFNNMEQEKLLQITKDALEQYGETCYRIRKYNILYREKEELKFRFVRHAAYVSDTLLHHIQKEEKYARNSVIVDLGSDEFLDNKLVLKILESYIKNCIFK